VRDAVGLMLIANLMAMAGLPSDSTDQRSSYIQARKDYLVNLRANHVEADVPTAVTG
jgi:hypothetical protein